MTKSKYFKGNPHSLPSRGLSNCPAFHPRNGIVLDNLLANGGKHWRWLEAGSYMQLGGRSFMSDFGVYS